MIINNVPIDLRYFHKMVLCWLRFGMRVRKPGERISKINFLYFSYAPDFECLKLSIHSATKHIDQNILDKIFIAEDQKAPFDDSQINELKAVYPKIEIMPIYNFSWGSAESTFAESKLFYEVSQKISNDSDFIAKVDSDVLFFNDSKLKKICLSKMPAVGDPRFLDYKFIQGGLYMMQKWVVERIMPTVTLEQVEQVNLENNSVGEDKAFSNLFAKKGYPFLFTRLMLFPDEYNGISKINSWVKKEFCALHFHKDKHNMKSVADKLGI